MPESGFPFIDFLSQRPELAYYSQPGQAAFTPNQQRIFRQPGQFQQSVDAYQGALGQQIRQGQNPTLSYLDFLNRPENQFLHQFNALTPEQRGMTPDVFNPRTQWLV